MNIALLFPFTRSRVRELHCEKQSDFFFKLLHNNVIAFEESHVKTYDVCVCVCVGSGVWWERVVLKELSVPLAFQKLRTVVEKTMRPQKKTVMLQEMRAAKRKKLEQKPEWGKKIQPRYAVHTTRLKSGTLME